MLVIIELRTAKERVKELLNELENTRFVWDDDKHDSNIEKHGVLFPEAVSVFDDPHAIYYYDERHSNDEERFIIIGMSEIDAVLVVCHCYRNGDSFTRIISARKATRQEHSKYMEGRG